MTGVSFIESWMPLPSEFFRSTMLERFGTCISTTLQAFRVWAESGHPTMGVVI